MSRRVRVPAADELFRATGAPGEEGEPGAASAASASEEQARVVSIERHEPSARQAAGPPEGGAPAKAPSGRVRHDEKMTVYVTSEELLDLEHARLVLRRLGHAVDRGRLVREAVAMVLADLESNGPDSALVRRLSQA